MRVRVRVAIVLLTQSLLAPSHGQSADWTLTDADVVRLHAGAVLVDSESRTERPPGEVRAAVQIRAPPERVFRTLTDCALALRFVPHLEHCAVLESSPDGTVQIVEQRVDPGWFIPSLYFVFRAELEPFRRIRFTHVRGDLRENRGEWTFQPTEDGTGTVVKYRVYVVPRVPVPQWLLRRTLRRDLPALLTGLRAQSESGHPAAASAGPRASRSRVPSR